jgi:hypothetical protein
MQEPTPYEISELANIFIAFIVSGTLTSSITCSSNNPKPSLDMERYCIVEGSGDGHF